MKWVKSNNNYRNAKIYSTTSKNKESFSLPGWFWKVLFLVILLLIAGWFLIYSEYFKIKNLEVNGYSNPSVKNAIQSLEGQNLILLSFGNIEEDLMREHSSIKDIQIDKVLPATLRVRVDVRKPEIIWQVSQKNYYIDPNGIIFSLDEEDDLTEDEKNNLLIIVDADELEVQEGSIILTKQFIDFFKETSNDFEQFTDAKITKSEISQTTFQIKIFTDKGFYVLLDTTREVMPQLEGLKKVLLEHKDNIKEYVDMRVEGKAYYK